jgi:hypothetical protein
VTVAVTVVAVVDLCQVAAQNRHSGEPVGKRGLAGGHALERQIVNDGLH